MPRDLAQGLAEMGQRAQAAEGFRADPSVLVGNFAFQKLAMVNDLTVLDDVLIENDVVAALAGDGEALNALLPSPEDERDLEMIDNRPPDDDYTVLDADASQFRVIRHLVNGRTGGISGPPGTSSQRSQARRASSGVFAVRSVS